MSSPVPFRERSRSAIARFLSPSLPPLSVADETTNKLFEAQVAVMGFKCRVMQLQGELDDRQREGWADASAREEIEHLRTENATLREDLKKVKEERDLARKQKTPSPQSASSSSSARIERVHHNVSL